MKKLGLIGYPLSHSFSEQYFAEKFAAGGIKDYKYRNYPLKDIADLPALIEEEPEMLGLNVTIPFKQSVMHYLDEIDEEAEKVGAVNTLLVNRTGTAYTLKGFNTDVYGFRETLYPLMKGETGKAGKGGKALILGTGGASLAVGYVLEQMGIKYQFVSRKYTPGNLEYKDLCLAVIRNTSLIINTTPLGTWPDIDKFPDVPYDILGPGHLLYDLVYNPPRTAFLRLGAQKGARVKNGQEMLELQAERSWEIWTGME